MLDDLSVDPEKEASETSSAEEENQQPDNTTVLESFGHVILSDETNSKLEDSDCRILLGSQLIAIEPPGSQRHEFRYGEIVGVRLSDYEVGIVLDGGFSCSFTQLGEKYDGFTRNLLALRNDQLASDFLIDEGKPSLSIRGLIEVTKKNNASLKSSEGEIRIYKTRLGIFTDEGEMFIARFAEISGFKASDYSISLDIGQSVGIQISQLGERFEQFTREFQSANSELSKDTSALLREICPTISFASLSKLSKLMPDGRPSRFKEVMALAPDFARSFQVQLEAGDDQMLKSMQYLLSPDVGDADDSLIGCKKLVSNYLYILIPITAAKDIVALESNEKGHATYFFKSKLEEMTIIIDGLRDVNFRRQPIYLTENDFLKPQFSRYNFALRKLETLRSTRERFIGRAIHSDFDAWKSQVLNIIASYNSHE